MAATVIGYVVDVSRFADRDHFASYNGTAPIEVSSGGHKVFRLSRRGNRRLNHAVHMAAVTQISHRHSEGRAYYDRKVKEGKTSKEALRCLKRRISDAIFAHLVADAKRRTMTVTAGPGGRRGNGSVSSGPAHTPSASSSDKPLPGPSQPYDLRRAPGTGRPGAATKEISKSLLTQRGLDLGCRRRQSAVISVARSVFVTAPVRRF